MFLLGVAGGSGSGKTTFAHKIMQRVDRPDVVLLHQDSYYLATPQLDHQVHGEPNFDHPEAFDWPLLRTHLAALKRGENIRAPIYDFKTSRRLAETQTIGPCRVLMFEGIYALWDDEIRRLMDLRVYLHVDADIRFIRRLHRDVRERSRTLDSIIRQYYDTVRPMHRQFLEPTQQYADISVGEETDLAADVLAAQVRERVLVAQNAR
ncbi:MAG: uridine kinase [Bdellovibrionota bacterium]